MKYGARMRIKRYYRGHSAARACAFDHCTHNQLMPEMESVKDPQGQDSGSCDLGIIGPVKKTHRVMSDG